MATGRRMKTRRVHWAARAAAARDCGSTRERPAPFAPSDERVARGHALAHRGDAAFTGSGRHFAQLDRLVRLHHVDEGALGAALDRLVRHQHRAAERVHQDARVDELVREQRAVAIDEGRLELDGAGARVDLVVHRHQDAGRQLGAALAVEGVDRDGPARALAGEHRRQVVLGNREDHRDRLHLGEHDEPARIAGVHHVAGIHEAEPGTAGDGGVDAGIRELEPNAVDLPWSAVMDSELSDRGGLVSICCCRMKRPYQVR